MITATEIAVRIARIRRYWLSGPPKIELMGQEKKFGILTISFGNCNHRIGIYIFNKKKIEELAKEAIDNFETLMRQHDELNIGRIRGY